MRSATTVTVATFGTMAALAGLEHGVGEVRQGDAGAPGTVFPSWPDSEWFAVLGGEPAMSVVPDRLITGTLAIAVSVIFWVWAVRFADTRHGGLVLALLSVLWLLVGGGFGPPLLGLILGAAASRIGRPPIRSRTHVLTGMRRTLARSWPWLLGAAVTTWLLLMPGTMIVDHVVGVDRPELLVPVLTLAAFGSLLLTLAAALARDRTDLQPAAGPPALAAADPSLRRSP